jgi:predicted phosphodiesterase
MIIRAFSDIHLEFDDSFVPKKLDTDPETVLVLAGDIHIGTKAIPWIKKFNERFKAIIYIPGNHEFYKHSIINLVKKMKDKVDELGMDNVFVLQNETKEIDGFHFIGTTLWTGFDNCDQLAMYNAELWMMDYKNIRIGPVPGNPYQMKLKPVHTAAEHQRAKEFITTELGKGYERNVVITHHIPSYNLIDKKYGIDVMSHSYASNLDDIIADNDIDLWIYGHSHSCRVEEHASTLFVQNCRGYFGHDLARGFNDGLIVEL